MYWNQYLILLITLRLIEPGVFVIQANFLGQGTSSSVLHMHANCRAWMHNYNLQYDENESTTNTELTEI